MLYLQQLSIHCFIVANDDGNLLKIYEKMEMIRLFIYDNGIEDGEFKRCRHLWRVSIDICNLVFLYTEDNDTTTEELSTSDISSEGLEEVMKKSYNSDYSDIGITQTSEGSANKVSILKMFTVAKLMGFIKIDSVQTSMCLCVCVFVYVHPCLQ